MVVIPAVIEAGAESKLCASLLQPNETLVMTITLISQEKKTDLFQKTSSTEFHTCVQFQVTSLHSIVPVVHKILLLNILNLMFVQDLHHFLLAMRYIKIVLCYRLPVIFKR